MHQSYRFDTLTSKMTAHAPTRVKSTRFVRNSKLARILLVTYTIYVAYQFFIICHRLQHIVIVYNYYNFISFVHLHTMHIYNKYVKTFKQEFVLKQEIFRRNVYVALSFLIFSFANVKCAYWRNL